MAFPELTPLQIALESVGLGFIGSLGNPVGLHLEEVDGGEILKWKVCSPDSEVLFQEQITDPKHGEILLGAGIPRYKG